MSALGTLLGKELRQVRRSRSAVLSATLVPLFLMVVAPFGQYMSLRSVPARAAVTGPVLPGLSELRQPEDILTLFFMPLLVIIVGLMVPTTAAVQSIVVERDRRTLELLIALPVGVREILLAKMGAMLVLAAVVLLPLFAVDAAWLLASGLATVGHVLLLLGLLLASVACSVSIGLLLALLARDTRTANQINGALIGPLIMLVLVILLGVPDPLRWAAVVGLLLLFALAGLVIALRWLTFERYLA